MLKIHLKQKQIISRPYLPVITSREELERGEAMHFDSFNLIDCGVHLGHNNVCVVFEFLTQLIPDGGQLFTVTTPWGIWIKEKPNRIQNNWFLLKANLHTL